MQMLIGEALVGDGSEIAHIDLMIGSKDGPVGTAFANAFSTQTEGHSNLLAVLAPNLAVKPSTVMITKVTIKGMRQALQMFGPAQAAVAKAVADSVSEKVIPQDQCEHLVIVCSIFIHPKAGVANPSVTDEDELARFKEESNRKIYDYNYQATKDAISSAMKQEPSVAAMIEQKDSAEHPYQGFTMSSEEASEAPVAPQVS